MTPQMGKLSILQTLTNFFVGKQNGSSIKKIGELKCLEKKPAKGKGEAHGSGGCSVGLCMEAERGEGRWVMVSGWGREDEKEKWPGGRRWPGKRKKRNDQRGAVVGLERDGF